MRREGGAWWNRGVFRSKSGGDRRFEENRPYNPFVFVSASPEPAHLRTPTSFPVADVTF